jgi:plastocyanin
MRFLPVGIFLALLCTAVSGCSSGSKDNSPVAKFNVTPKGDGVTFLFDATNTTDPDNKAEELAIAWSFGDEGTSQGYLYSKDPERSLGLIEYQYAVTNTVFTVSLVVRDPDGHASSHTERVSLGSGVNLPPDIHTRNATRWVKPGSGVVIDASKSDDHDKDFFSYEWILGPYDAKKDLSFDSGPMPPAGHYQHTFDANGVYDLQCTKHPWMKGRVFVSDTDKNSTDVVLVRVANFTFEPKTAFVKPGGTITWLNGDPVNHTATTERATAGKIVHTGPVFSSRLDKGDYVARLTLNDGKGGVFSETWGLRASDDAPPSPDVRELINQTDASHVDGSSQLYDKSVAYESKWTANLTATVSWTDNLNMGKFTMGLERDGKAVTRCVVEGSSCTLSYNLEPAKYTLHVKGGGTFPRGSLVLTTSAINYSYPGFGDSPPLVGHHTAANLTA